MLLVEADFERRNRLSRALRAEGMPVLAVSGIAEVERWPAGELVVTDSHKFTTLWRDTGAAHVVVLADTAEEGMDACDRGATAWIPRRCTADAIVDALYDLGVMEPELAVDVLNIAC